MTHITSTGADFRHFYAGHPTRKHDPQQHPKRIKMTRKNHLSKLPSKTTPKTVGQNAENVGHNDPHFYYPQSDIIITLKMGAIALTHYPQSMLAQTSVNKEQTTMIIRYDIIDKQTGAIVATAKTRKSASRIIDRRDNAYGAYRYSARPIYA